MQVAVTPLLILLVELLALAASSHHDQEAKATEYLAKLNEEFRTDTNKEMIANWNHATNITKENLVEKLNVLASNAIRAKARWKKTIRFNWQSFKNADVRRQFKIFSVLGTSALPIKDYQHLKKLVSEMTSVYSKAQICSYKNKTKCDLSLEPELVKIMSTSQDPEELAYTWQAWRDASGKKCRRKWERYVSLSNKAAVLNNVTDNAEFWLVDYEIDDLPRLVEKLWKQVRPLYLQIHAYVRRRLVEKYGNNVIDERGPIPAHLLGNMWAQSWNQVYNFTAPFPGKTDVDVTNEMVQQGYTPLKMFRLADEFFASLGLRRMPDGFWQNSIIEKPKDGRDIVCHASAWDFYDGQDFRIKMCTDITMNYLKTVHHEMGHVQYYLEYKGQPPIYREGANPGFHEAVGDVIALSVMTPKHLQKIYLLARKNNQQDKQQDSINYLFFQGLQKVAFLPYAYMLDKFRWSVFKRETHRSCYNCDYWQLRHEIQGIEPPVDRSEEDFDVGAKYHVVADVPYIRYFVSFIIQFQFHRALCIKADQFDPNNPELKPLHECDIFESREAGAALSKMLRMGRSQPWQEAMEALTGQTEIDASGLLDYFQPLMKWLTENNRKHDQAVGWQRSNKKCLKKPVSGRTNFSNKGSGIFASHYLQKLPMILLAMNRNKSHC